MNRSCLFFLLLLAIACSFFGLRRHEHQRGINTHLSFSLCLLLSPLGCGWAKNGQASVSGAKEQIDRKMRLIGVWAAAVVLCLGLVLVPSRYGVVDAIQLDIHIKLDDATNDLVMKLGREITRLAPHNQVDFDTLAEPHVTLYLADFPFAHILDLIETVKQAAPLFHRCPVTLNNTVVSGISLFIFYLLYLLLSRVINNNNKANNFFYLFVIYLCVRTLQVPTCCGMPT
jgi:hypothetical protein